MSTAKHYGWLTLGWVLAVTGFLVFITPMPGGILMMSVGLFILAYRSRAMRRLIARMRQRFPGTTAHVFKIRPRLPRALRYLIHRTEPRRVLGTREGSSIGTR